MLARITMPVVGIIVAPLMLGIGIGIGAASVAGAATLERAVQPALTVIACATTGACATVTNSAHGGTGVLASSPNGLGVRGLSTLSVGVTGESIASIGVNGKSVKGAGVHGASANADAVVGVSTGSGNAAGVVGSNALDSVDGATGGPGVRATSISGSGLVVSNGPDRFGTFGLSNAPTATIDARQTFGDALDIFTGSQTSGRDYPNSGPAIATLTATGTSASIGSDITGISVQNAAAATGEGLGPPGDGLFADATYGNGIVGSSESAATGADGNGPPLPVSAVVAYAAKGADLYLGFGKGTFEVTNDGNVNATGTITSGVTCAPTTCPTGTMRAAFVTRNAAPTIEDTGRAQLTGGIAAVALDPVFAGTIDPARGYSVLVTPEGDTRGLYVASRTLRGFTVAENMNGRSNVTFSYRIVAAPYGSSVTRLPIASTQRAANAANTHRQALLGSARRRAATVRAAFASRTKTASPAKHE